jgi:hypothetical protein
MFKLCNFCLEKVTAKDAVSVNDLMIDKSPGFIKLTEIGISLEFAVSIKLRKKNHIYRNPNFRPNQSSSAKNVWIQSSISSSSEKVCDTTSKNR